MAMFQYLKQNAKWMVKKQRFSHMLATPVTEEELYIELEKMLNTATETFGRVDFYELQFALNEIALSRTTNDLQKALKQQFFSYESTFNRVKNALTSGFELFSTYSNGVTRMESLCQLFIISTQMRHSETAYQNFKQFIQKNNELSANERRFFDDFFNLVKCRYFCAVFYFCSRSVQNGEFFAANLLPSVDLLKCRFDENDYYSKTSFTTENLTFAVDCFANSTMVKDNCPTGVFLSTSVTQNRRNVFDTFTHHKYGKRSANFLALNGSTQVSMQYFVRSNSEFRRYRIISRAKDKKLFRISLNCGVQLSKRHTLNYFESQQAHCVGISGNDSYYVAFAVVFENKIMPVSATFDENGLTASLNLEIQHNLTQNSDFNFDVVTIFATSIQQLTSDLSMCNKFGFTACSAISDTQIEGQLYALETNVSPASNLMEKRSSTLPSPILNYSYQFGDSNVASFLSSDGTSVTLLDGFVFGTFGEKLYALSPNAATEINRGIFTVTPNGFVQSGASPDDGATTLKISHDSAKHYSISFPKPMRLLAIFSLEQTSSVKFFANTFEIFSQNRHFKFVVGSEIESFTTNAIECNSARLRYKLSNNLNSGQCLAICFRPTETVNFKIENCKTTALSVPTIRESLLSTYLNYINEKNLFCLKNKLRPADALTVSALAYTNSDFLEQYITSLENSNYFQNFTTDYYDNSANLVPHFDKMLYALATIYFVTLTGKTEFLTHQRLSFIKEILLHEPHSGIAICHKALALKRLANLNFDKVNLLSEYCKVKRDIISNKTLYGYAQAIGALELINPTKQRLKDLCNSFNVPKSWYYVSQLENLYGIKINGDILSVKPTVSTENTLEQFVLNYGGKKILTKFEKSPAQSMLLNGVCYFNCLKSDTLNEGENQLLVRY